MADTSLLHFRRVGIHNRDLGTGGGIQRAIAVLLEEYRFVLQRRVDAF